MTEQTVLALITCQTYPEPSDNLKTLAACLETMGVKTVFDAWQNHPSGKNRPWRFIFMVSKKFPRIQHF